MRLPISILLINVFLLCGNVRAEEIDPNRLAKETASLFQVVMSEEDAPKRCIYGLDWLAYPVPEYVAQKYFGLTLHSALVPPEVEKDRLRFEDIVDPGGTKRDAFCSQSQSDASGKARFAAFAKDASVKESVFDRVGFTLPIFDADYRKAVVIAEHYESKAVRLDTPTPAGLREPGKTMIFPPEGADVAKIFIKTKDGWQLFDSELVGQT